MKKIINTSFLVLVTHDREIAARCERQLRIEAGRIDAGLPVL